MSPHDDAWFAGMFEGEGTLGVYHSIRKGKEYGSVVMRITSTDYDVLDTLLAVAGCGSIGKEYRDNRPSKEHYKPYRSWEVKSLAATQLLLRRIRPYLHARRGARADEVLALRPIDPTRPGRAGGKDPDRLCRAGLHSMNGKRYCRPCANAKRRANYAAARI